MVVLCDNCGDLTDYTLSKVLVDYEGCVGDPCGIYRHVHVCEGCQKQWSPSDITQLRKERLKNVAVR